MPRPTRTRLLRAPWLSRISLSFMSCTRFRFCRAWGRWPQELRLVLDLDQVLDFLDLPHHFRGRLDLDRAVHLVEPEPDQGRALGFVAADRRAGLGDLDLRHVAYSV